MIFLIVKFSRKFSFEIDLASETEELDVLSSWNITCYQLENGSFDESVSISERNMPKSQALVW